MPRIRRNWTPTEIGLLGSDTDANIAKKLGRSECVVADKRRQMDIPIFYSHRPWTPEEDAQVMSHAPASEIAKRLGRTVSSIHNRRQKLGARQPPDWTPEEDALLGQIPDKEVAQKTGKHIITVRNRRNKLGLKPYTRPIPCGQCGELFTPKAGAQFCPACRRERIMETKRKSRRKWLQSLTPEELEKVRQGYRKNNRKKWANPELRIKQRALRREQYIAIKNDPEALAKLRERHRKSAQQRQRRADLARLQNLVNSVPNPPA